MPRVIRHWLHRQRGRAALIAVLPASIVLAAWLGAVLPSAGVTFLKSAIATPTPVPTLPPAAEIAARPISTATTLPPTALPPTPTLRPYHMSQVEPPTGLGIAYLYLLEPDTSVQMPPIDASELRLPTPNLRPQTGRFGEIRGPFRLTHLGSDYLNPHEDLLLPPHEEAILVGTVYLQRNKYQAIAIDMSGEIQMYMITIMVDGVPRDYIFCYAHLRDGSNQEAVRHALEHQGHVEIMGNISTVSRGDPNLSDIHIGVIDVEALYRFTETRDVGSALRRLFAGLLPRTNQQYPDIFVEPESVYPALADALARDTE